MFYQLNLLTLLVAPLLAYSAAALFFSLITLKQIKQRLPKSLKKCD